MQTVRVQSFVRFWVVSAFLLGGLHNVSRETLNKDQIKGGNKRNTRVGTHT